MPILLPMLYLVIFLTLAGMTLSYFKNKLTFAGSLSGGIIAILVYSGAGLTGFIMMAAFFIMAILATSYKRKEKRKVQDSGHQVKRNARQVWANGGMAGLAGALSLFMDPDQIFAIIIAAVFSSAAADTISSELGMVKGKRFINILTLKEDRKGRDGVISVEGCLWGLAASIVIAGIYYAGFGTPSHFLIILMAGTIGNISDSILGASLERKGIVGNDAVNLLNTIIAGITAVLLF